MVFLTLSPLACGCAGRTGITKTITVPAAARPVALEATHDQLVDRYRVLAEGLQSLDSTATLKPFAGSAYTGLINEYHEVKSFLIASRPYNIRMIGQVPVVGTTVFDMASNGRDFQVSLPTKNKFIVGPVALNRSSAQPIENLRPQHLVDALLWPELRKEEVTLFEEFNDESVRYYIVTVLRGGYQTEILHKMWFDRADLSLVRLQTYGPKGVLLSDVRYSDWQPPDNASPAVPAYPRTIHVERPHDEYRLDLAFNKVLVNEALNTDQFQLQAPEGAEAVRLTNAGGDKQP